MKHDFEYIEPEDDEEEWDDDDWEDDDDDDDWQGRLVLVYEIDRIHCCFFSVLTNQCELGKEVKKNV